MGMSMCNDTSFEEEQNIELINVYYKSSKKIIDLNIDSDISHQKNQKHQIKESQEYDKENLFKFQKSLNQNLEKISQNDIITILTNTYTTLKKNSGENFYNSVKESSGFEFFSSQIKNSILVNHYSLDEELIQEIYLSEINKLRLDPVEYAQNLIELDKIIENNKLEIADVCRITFY